jgi:hypothetical protein
VGVWTINKFLDTSQQWTIFIHCAFAFSVTNHYFWMWKEIVKLTTIRTEELDGKFPHNRRVYIIFFQCGSKYVDLFKLCPLECSITNQKPKKHIIAQQFKVRWIENDRLPSIIKTQRPSNVSTSQCISNMFNEYNLSFPLDISAWNWSTSIL